MPTLRVRAFNGPADFAVPRGTKIIHGDSHRGSILMACPDGPNVPHKLVAIQVSEVVAVDVVATVTVRGAT